MGPCDQRPNKGAIEPEASGTELPSILSYWREKQKDNGWGAKQRDKKGPGQGQGRISQTVRAGAKWTPDLRSPLVKLCTRGRLICHTMGGNPPKNQVPLRNPWGDYKESAISREPYIGISGAIYQTKAYEIRKRSTS